MIAVVVVLAGAAAVVGGTTRYVASLIWNNAWPSGTLFVNVTGSFAAGALFELTGSAQTIMVLAGLGAMTSLSAVAGEVGTMFDVGRRRSAFAYMGATSVGTVLAAWVGLNIT